MGIGYKQKYLLYGGRGATLYVREYTTSYRFVKQFIYLGESAGCGYA